MLGNAQLSGARILRGKDQDWGKSIADDRRRIKAVLNEIGSQARLAVDANGRFDLGTAIDYARMLRDYDLFWFEEASDPLDYQLQAALGAFYPGPMGTGEIGSAIRMRAT